MMNPMRFLWSLLMFCAMPLYLNNSKSKASTTTENNNYNTDKRLVTDSESVGVSADNSTVSVYRTTTNSMSDQGSIEKAFKFATDASKSASADFSKVLDVVNDSLDFTKASAQMTTQAQQDMLSTVQDNITGNKYLVTLGMIVAGVVGLAVFGQNIGKIKL